MENREVLEMELLLTGMSPLLSGELADLVKMQSVTFYLVRISCDTDGWVVKSNKEKDYPTFLHIIQPVEILDIQVRDQIFTFGVLDYFFIDR